MTSIRRLNFGLFIRDLVVLAVSCALVGLPLLLGALVPMLEPVDGDDYRGEGNPASGEAGS
jgi:hypothetical protein